MIASTKLASDLIPFYRQSGARQLPYYTTAIKVVAVVGFLIPLIFIPLSLFHLKMSRWVATGTILGATLGMVPLNIYLNVKRARITEREQALEQAMPLPHPPEQRTFYDGLGVDLPPVTRYGLDTFISFGVVPYKRDIPPYLPQLKEEYAQLYAEVAELDFVGPLPKDPETIQELQAAMQQLQQMKHNHWKVWQQDVREKLAYITQRAILQQQERLRKLGVEPEQLEDLAALEERVHQLDPKAPLYAADIAEHTEAMATFLQPSNAEEYRVFLNRAALERDEAQYIAHYRELVNTTLQRRGIQETLNEQITLEELYTVLEPIPNEWYHADDLKKLEDFLYMEQEKQFMHCTKHLKSLRRIVAYEKRSACCYFFSKMGPQPTSAALLPPLAQKKYTDLNRNEIELFRTKMYVQTLVINVVATAALAFAMIFVKNRWAYVGIFLGLSSLDVVNYFLDRRIERLEKKSAQLKIQLHSLLKLAEEPPQKPARRHSFQA